MKQAARSLFLAVMGAVFLWQSAAHAAIYQCVDRMGAVSFTNAPSSQNCRAMEEEWRPTLQKPKPGYYRYETSSFGGFGLDSSAYDQHIRMVGLRYGVDPYLIKAMIRTESDFDHNAISSKGAQGLMQLMPGTARDLNVLNPFDPRENIDGGVRYLRSILDAFDGNLPLSLAAYNAGPNLVKRVQKIPAIPETVAYVKRVLFYYRVYKAGSVQRVSQFPAIKVHEMVTKN